MGSGKRTNSDRDLLSSFVLIFMKNDKKTTKQKIRFRNNLWHFLLLQLVYCKLLLSH